MHRTRMLVGCQLLSLQCVPMKLFQTTEVNSQLVRVSTSWLDSGCCVFCLEIKSKVTLWLWISMEGIIKSTTLVQHSILSVRGTLTKTGGETVQTDTHIQTPQLCSAQFLLRMVTMCPPWLSVLIWCSDQHQLTPEEEGRCFLLHLKWTRLTWHCVKCLQVVGPAVQEERSWQSVCSAGGHLLDHWYFSGTPGIWVDDCGPGERSTITLTHLH